VALGRLAAELLANTRALARWYGEAAAATRIEEFRDALEALAAAKATQAGRLEPFAEAVGPQAGPAPAPASPAVPATDLGQRGALFSVAFPAERALTVAYQEVAALLGDPARFPLLSTLAVQAARDQATLRELYLRYS
jgi:hypothetical protein